MQAEVTVHQARGTMLALRISMWVAIIGAINWGLIGLLNWNLVDAIFGGGVQETTSTASRVVYTLVGLAGLLALFLMPARRLQAGVGR